MITKIIMTYIQFSKNFLKISYAEPLKNYAHDILFERSVLNLGVVSVVVPLLIIVTIFD